MLHRAVVVRSVDVDCRELEVNYLPNLAVRNLLKPINRPFLEGSSKLNRQKSRRAHKVE